MLTTQTPWAGIEPAAVHLHVAMDAPPPLSSLPDDISSALVSAIKLMLRRELEQRPSVVELLAMKPFNEEEVRESLKERDKNEVLKM